MSRFLLTKNLSDVSLSRLKSYIRRDPFELLGFAFALALRARPCHSMYMVFFREILEDLDGIFGKTHVLIQA